MAQNEHQESQKTHGFQVWAGWAGVIGALVSAAVAVWATKIDQENSLQKVRFDELSQELEEQRLEIESQRFFLQKQREDLERYDYIRENLYDDLISTDTQKQKFAINLVQLVLTHEEYQSLFNGLALSQDQNVKDLAETALNLQQQRVQQDLQEKVQNINSPVKSTRLQATDILKNQYADNTEVIQLVLDLFDPASIDALSAAGRINALFYLNNTDLTAWTPELVAQAESVIELLEQRHQAGIAIIGTQTRQYLEEFKRHLAQVEA
jgi:hypothetical protein